MTAQLTLPADYKPFIVVFRNAKPFQPLYDRLMAGRIANILSEMLPVGSSCACANAARLYMDLRYQGHQEMADEIERQFMAMYKGKIRSIDHTPIVCNYLVGLYIIVTQKLMVECTDHWRDELWGFMLADLE